MKLESTNFANNRDKHGAIVGHRQDLSVGERDFEFSLIISSYISVTCDPPIFHLIIGINDGERINDDCRSFDF